MKPLLMSQMQRHSEQGIILGQVKDTRCYLFLVILAINSITFYFI